MTKFPHVLIVTDGASIRTIHPPSLTEQDRMLLVGIVERALAPPQPAKPVEIPHAKAAMMTQGEIARESGYLGDACDMCHQFKLRRTGTCITCEACGNNSGCS